MVFNVGREDPSGRDGKFVWFIN